MLNLSAIQISHAQEHFSIVLLHSTDDSADPERVHFEATLVVAAANPAVIVTRFKESGAILLNLISLLLLCKHFLKVLGVRHFA